MTQGGVPALSAGTAIAPLPVAASTAQLENELLRVRFDNDGVIVSILDKANDREVIPTGGAANLLQLHPDHPVKWDAWDLDGFYRHTVTDVRSADAIDVHGDALVVRRSFGNSTIVERISLCDRRIDVELDIDWHERERVLKVAGDLDVHTDHARYETQFGHVTRPTHENTTWDAARFEVCAHRWVHVGESDYGVAVANDSTYGHDVTRHPKPGGGTYSRVRLSLLRAPRFPDPDTDQGSHRLRYSLIPGATVADAVHAGYALNVGLRSRIGSAVEPVVTVQGSVAVEAIKLAEDGSGDVIVRLYEPLGARAIATVTPSFSTSSIVEVDLLERPLSEPAAWDGEALRMRPFMITTLRLAR